MYYKKKNNIVSQAGFQATGFTQLSQPLTAQPDTLAAPLIIHRQTTVAQPLLHPPIGTLLHRVAQHRFKRPAIAADSSWEV